MNLKSKLVSIAGVAAALTLGLGFSSSALADTNPTSATLDDTTSVLCSVAAQGASVDFGTFTWDAVNAEWVGDYTPSFNVVITDTSPNAPHNCDVSVSGIDLANTVDSSYAIAAADIALDAASTTGGLAVAALDPGGQLYNDVVANTSATPSYPVAVTLANDALDGLIEGSYEGTITFTGTLGTP